MTATPWHRRFYKSTRGRLVGLLRRGPCTVEDLAGELAVSPNAVRAHLAVLERDGMVAQTGLRRGARKPAFVYELTPDAERLFPKALGAVLRELLHVLDQRLDEEELASALSDTGRRLAKSRLGRRDADLYHRVREGMQALDDLGGSVELEKHDGRYTIHGLDCPLREVVAEHPQVCFLAEALLAEIVGAEVRQRCQRGPDPRCRFEVSPYGRRGRAEPGHPEPRRGGPSGLRRKPRDSPHPA